MNQITPTTEINPGAFKKAERVRIKKLVSKSWNLLRTGNWAKFYLYLCTESINLFNQYRSETTPRFICVVCKQSSRYFLHRSDDLRISWNSVCPNCDSRSRHRGLYMLYTDLIRKSKGEKKKLRILHFAPEPVFYPLFRSEEFIEYKTTDYFLEDVDFQKEDIQSLSFADHSYDIILCNHVLEHVPEDERAMEEINRVLAPNGTAIITIPGDYSREKTIFFSHLRYNGHYRDYGMDVVEKFRSVFGKVEVKDLFDWSKDDGGLVRGIRQYDLAFICHKNMGLSL